jgi:hypothetical protein
MGAAIRGAPSRDPPSIPAAYSSPGATVARRASGNGGLGASDSLSGAREGGALAISEVSLAPGSEEGSADELL